MFSGIPTPMIVKATLLPFRDVIISNGLVSAFPIRFGRNMVAEFKNSYMTAKMNKTIISRIWKVQPGRCPGCFVLGKTAVGGTRFILRLPSTISFGTICGSFLTAILFSKQKNVNKNFGLTPCIFRQNMVLSNQFHTEYHRVTLSHTKKSDSMGLFNGRKLKNSETALFWKFKHFEDFW